MATSNKSVTSEWQLIVAAAAASCLVSNRSPTLCEVADTADDATAPSGGVLGHVLMQYKSVTRQLIPSGAIWARTMRVGDTATLAVN